MALREEIITWIINHPESENMSTEEIAKAMLHEAIDNTTWAEEAYPGIKDNLHRTVDNQVT